MKPLKLNPLSKRITGTTKDYSLFLPVEGNRPLNQSHINKLVDSMKKNGNISAIICREVEGKDGQKYFEVMDGQHRLEALKIMDFPVEFDSWQITNRGMISLNENQKNWTLEDYKNFGVKDGIKDYITLDKYYQESGIKLTALLEIFGGNKIDPERSNINSRRQFEERGVRYDAFKRLEWKIPNEQRSLDILKMLLDFRDRFNILHWKNHRFVSAFITILNSGNYDHERMMRQMEKCSNMLRRQSKQGDFVQNFEDVYNHQLSGIRRTLFKK